MQDAVAQATFRHRLLDNERQQTENQAIDIRKVVVDPVESVANGRRHAGQEAYTQGCGRAFA